MKRIYFVCLLLIATVMVSGMSMEAKTQKRAKTSVSQTAGKGYKISGNKIVPTAGLPVVIDFYTDWCGWCKPYKEELEKVEKRMQGKAIFIRINAESQTGLANYYKVNCYPFTVVLYPNGNVATTIEGYVEETPLYNTLRKYF